MWDYRVFRKKEEKGDRTFIFYHIYEVYYDENGGIVSISEEPVTLYGDTLINYLSEIKKYINAFTLPILDWVEVDATIHLSSSATGASTNDYERDSKDRKQQQPLSNKPPFFGSVSQSNDCVEENPLCQDTRKHEEVLEAKRLESESLHEKLLLNANESTIFDFLKNLPQKKRIH